VFGLIQKDVSSVFAFSSAAVYVIRESPAEQEGLRLNANKGFVGVILIYSHNRIVLEAMIS